MAGSGRKGSSAGVPQFAPAHLKQKQGAAGDITAHMYSSINNVLSSFPLDWHYAAAGFTA